MEYEGLGFDYRAWGKKKYAIYLACSLVILGCTYLEITTKYASIDSIAKECKVKSLEVEKLEHFKYVHDDFPEYIKRLEKANARVRKDLPKSYNEQAFLQVLEENLGSLKLVNVTLPNKQDIVAVKNAQEVKICPAYVALEGDYYDVLKFLKALEARHFAITKLKITADRYGYLKISMTIGNFICP